LESSEPTADSAVYPSPNDKEQRIMWKLALILGVACYAWPLVSLALMLLGTGDVRPLLPSALVIPGVIWVVVLALAVAAGAGNDHNKES
jgi:hypothetical protein